MRAVSRDHVPGRRKAVLGGCGLVACDEPLVFSHMISDHLVLGHDRPNAAQRMRRAGEKRMAGGD